jgi:asparagine synthase (glutamine-hydrolysing)
MSIIFGVRNAEAQSVDERHMLHLAQATARYAQNGTFVSAKGRIGMGFQPYHTHQRSNLELKPLADSFGNMVALDGRLDNHKELCGLLNLANPNVADSAIVLAAFRKWSEGCFACLTGDWSLALWSHSDRSLYLARDHAGTRSLYFEQVGDCIYWSTYLETFFVEEQSRSLEKRFAVRHIAGLDSCDLTPYSGIMAVTPAHFVRFHENSLEHRSHWNWLQHKAVFYSSDAEYEAHFLSLFKQAVERRTGPGAPILAELSGGMDSTSIVCMSDQLRKETQDGPEQLLDTISYYDDSEPDWDERRYFELTERHRSKRGVHLSSSLANRTFQLPSENPSLYLLPGADLYTSKREAELKQVLDCGAYRVILSGIGGDEVLGGVPTPDPELGDCFVSGKPRKLVARTLDWCLIDRTPLAHRLFHTAGYVARLYPHADAGRSSMPGWLADAVISKRHPFERVRPMHGKLGWCPSSISNAAAWWSVLNSLPNSAHNIAIRYERRYPFLDKDLVNFLFQIPRSQIVRPGQRRSLMRRALKNIVPNVILDRPRKGFIRRALPSLLQAEKPRLLSLFERSRLGDCGLIDEGLLRKRLNETDGTTGVLPILRAGWLELWLQSSKEKLTASPSKSEIDARTIRAHAPPGRQLQMSTERIFQS